MTNQNTDWRRRFQITQNFPQLARANPQRGLVTSNRSGVFQLYAWDVESGALQQLTSTPTGRTWGVLAPNAEAIYYLRDEAGNERGHVVRVPFEGGSEIDMTPELPPYSILGLSISGDSRILGINRADQDGFHLLVLEAHEQPGPAHTLRSFAGITMGPTLSYDGKLVAVASSERAEGKMHFSLLVLDGSTGESVAELWDGPASSITASQFSRVPGDTRLLASTNRSGVKRPLVWEPFTDQRHDFVLPAIDGDVEVWDWSPDARLVLLGNIREAVPHLLIYDLEEQQVRQLPSIGGNIVGAQFMDNQRLMALWTDATHPFQTLELELATGSQQRVLFPAEDVPPSRPWRSVSFPSSDGQLIQAWLALPEGEGPFPTILETHGGPTGVTIENFDPGAQMWLDHGFAFMSVNYRGSITFGKAFEEQIWNDLGHWELEDMAAARSWLINEGIAQPDAILLTGWSYGGYLTLMGIGKQPELWAAGMAGIAIADWSIQWEDTAPTLRGYQEALLGGTPAQNPEQYQRSSPISYAEQIAAPILVIQGSNDTRCPSRPMHLYESRLRELGKQIEVEWFEAGHGSYDTAQRIQHHEHMLNFALRVLD